MNVIRITTLFAGFLAIHLVNADDLRIVPAVGLEGFAELGATLHDVGRAAEEQNYDVIHDVHELGVTTIMIPKLGAIIFGDHTNRVGAIDCYLKPHWSDYEPFTGYLFPNISITTSSLPRAEITKYYDIPPVVPLKGSQSRKLRGESYTVVLPNGESYQWHGTHGLGFSFDSDGILTKIRIERAMIQKNDRQRINNHANHGLESTGAPPAAKAPETHP